mmetsp:Transcript_113848/g.317998  ORF Transcript_113848/g.317998 Transcript_113848/m.317998 type:complete len:381 (-) Transcript_113848:134-1276(-)
MQLRGVVTCAAWLLLRVVAGESADCAQADVPEVSLLQALAMPRDLHAGDITISPARSSSFSSGGAMCGWVPVDGVIGGAMVCRPPASKTQKRWPLFIFGHGDLMFPSQYAPTMLTVASQGFVVAAYWSCIHVIQGDTTTQCDAGLATFVEVLKIVDFFSRHPDANPDIAPVNMSESVTVGGHSGGGRAALMVAAVRDSPGYLKDTPYAKVLDGNGGAFRKAAKKIGAAIALYGDGMEDPLSNPDVDGFRDAISETPVLLQTSTDDDIVPYARAWWNFRAIRSATKVYFRLDSGLDGHSEPVLHAVEAPWMARFAQASMGNQTAKALIYDDCKVCLRHSMKFAKASRDEATAATPGILLCTGSGRDSEVEGASLCGAPSSK